jgi:hypothetical protein
MAFSPEALNTIAALTGITVVTGGLAYVVAPLAKAWARRIEGGAGNGADLEELRVRLQELEARDARLVELEERLDFTERRLARPQDVARLPEQ